MSKFYLTDPNIFTLPLTDLQFRIYQYLCAQYNVKKQQAFIRIVNIGGQFQLTKDEVQEQLIELSKIKHLDLPLISIKQENYISFDMPAHKKFLESIGFKKFSTYNPKYSTSASEWFSFNDRKIVIKYFKKMGLHFLQKNSCMGRYVECKDGGFYKK